MTEMGDAVAEDMMAYPSEKKTRKTRSDKGTKRTDESGAKTKPKATTKNLEVERAMAAGINALIASYVAKQYSEMPDPPNAAETEHLARLLKMITGVPPFSFIVGFIRKVLPFSGTGKAGQNPFADLLKYLTAWYRRNTDLTERIYIGDSRIPDIPVYPKAAVFQRRAAPFQDNGRIVRDNGPIMAESEVENGTA